MSDATKVEERTDEDPPSQDLDVARLATAFAQKAHEVQVRVLELISADKLGEETTRLFTVEEATTIARLPLANTRSLLHRYRDEIEVQKVGTRVMLSANSVRQLCWAVQKHTRSALPERMAGQAPFVLTTGNLKGGSSKTTLTVHIAEYLALRGLNVLLIDLDAQASASHYMGLSPDRMGAQIGTDDTMYGVLLGERGIDEVIRPTYWPGLSIVPATIGLADMEYQLADRHMRYRSALEREDLAALSRMVPFYGVLDRALADLPPDAFDVVLVDTHPDVSFLTVSALATSDALLCPIPVGMLDFASTGEFFRVVAEYSEIVREAEARRPTMARARRPFDYKFISIVPSLFDPRHEPETRLLGFLQYTYGSHLLEPVLYSKAMRRSSLERKTLFEAVAGRGDNADLDVRTASRLMESMLGMARRVEDLIRREWRA
jgi:chromosome partitioning protein